MFFRKRIEDRNIYSALLEMSTLPNFNKSLAKFLHKKISNESFKTCRTLGEKGVEITRDFLENYSVDEKYEKLLHESPLLMSVLHAACCRQKFKEIKVPNKPFSSYTVLKSRNYAVNN